MKINIIGPSGSGKTHLAKLLSEKYKVLNVNLDEVLFIKLSGKKRKEANKDRYLKKLKNIFKKKEWIIEGLQPIKEVLDEAETIIWLRPPFYISLYQQWKRYFNDKEQRENYGFLNNLKLSRYILRQYFGKPTLITNPKKTWIKSAGKELRKYEDKLIIIRKNCEKEDLAKLKKGKKLDTSRVISP